MCYTTFLSHFDGLVKMYTILWITVILMAWSYRDWQEIVICWLEHVLLETGRWMWLKSNMSFTKLCYIFTQQGTRAGYGKQKMHAVMMQSHTYMYIQMTIIAVCNVQNIFLNENAFNNIVSYLNILAFGVYKVSERTIHQRFLSIYCGLCYAMKFGSTQQDIRKLDIKYILWISLHEK